MRGELTCTAAGRFAFHLGNVYTQGKSVSSGENPERIQNYRDDFPSGPGLSNDRYNVMCARHTGVRWIRIPHFPAFICRNVCLPADPKTKRRRCPGADLHKKPTGAAACIQDFPGFHATWRKLVCTRLPKQHQSRPL